MNKYILTELTGIGILEGTPKLSDLSVIEIDGVVYKVEKY